MAKTSFVPLILVFLLAAGLLTRQWLGARPIVERVAFSLSELPERINDEIGVDLPLTPFEVQLLAPDGGEILQRRYGSDEGAIWLSAVQSHTDWRVQHPPQVCYIAQGWNIDEKADSKVDIGNERTVPVQRMVVHKGEDRRVVYYFYSDGRHWTASYFLRVYASALDRMLRAESSTWLMVQVSTFCTCKADEIRLARAVARIFAGVKEEDQRRYR